MLFLLIKSGKNYQVICPETYGSETWGCTSQEGITKKRKNWYLTYWRAGNEWVDDYYEENKIKVVLETTNTDEIISYLENKLKDKKDKKEIVESVIVDLDKIFKDWVSIEKWIREIK